jgi:hypothetical protein
MSPRGVDSGYLVVDPPLLFPGFVETGFSTAKNRFYYKDDGSQARGIGSYAVLEQYVPHLSPFLCDSPFACAGVDVHAWPMMLSPRS